MLNNPVIGLEERLAVLLSVMQHKLACVVVLDGLECALESRSGTFLEPAMAFFWNGFLRQSHSLSRLLLASRLLPNGGSTVVGTESGYRHQRLGPGSLERQPAFQALIQQLDESSRQALRAMTLFHYPMPLSAHQAVTRWQPLLLEKLLQQFAGLGLAFCSATEGEPLWSLHPLLRQLSWSAKEGGGSRFAKLLVRAGRYLCRQAEQDSSPLGLDRWTLRAEGIGYLLQALPWRRQDLFAEILSHAEPLCDWFVQGGFYWELEHFCRGVLSVREHPRIVYWLALALLRRQCREEAEPLLHQVLTFSEQTFAKECALARFELAGIWLQQNPEAAKDHLLQALAINQRVGDLSGQAVCHAHLGFWGLRQAEMAIAQHHLDAALHGCRLLDDQNGIANLLPWTGELHWRVGNVVTARDHFLEALQRMSDGNHTEKEAQLRHRLAIMDLGEEQYDQALAGFLRALALNRQSGNRHGEAVIFFQLGRLAKAKGDDFASLQLLGLSQRIGQELGDPDAGQLLILFRELAVTVLHVNRMAAELILDGVWMAYCQDRGDTLLRQVFGVELL